MRRTAQAAATPIGASQGLDRRAQRLAGGAGLSTAPACAPGHAVAGPAIVNEQTTTILVGAGDRLDVDAAANFNITIATGACMTALDPISLALVQNRLDHIAQQMGWVMIRTSRSPIFNQSHDFSCFITDAAGTLVSQADGIPIHTGGGGFAVRALLKAFAGRIDPDDVFLLNDPYVAGGNHLPDWVIARPVFAGGAAGRLRLQPRAPVRHRRRRRRHLQPAGDRDLPRGHPPAGAEADRARRGARRPLAAADDQHALPGAARRRPARDARLDADRRASRSRSSSTISASTPRSRYFEGILDHADRRLRAALAALPDGVYRARGSVRQRLLRAMSTFRSRVALDQVKATA